MVDRIYSWRYRTGQEEPYSSLNDQFTDYLKVDDIGFPSKVIFSTNAYLHLIQLVSDSAMSHFAKENGVGEERGCFFYGRELVSDYGENCNIILIDDYSPQCRVANSSVLENGSIDPNSVLPLVNYKVDSNNYDCVFYFHVHPRFNNYYDTFSTGDYNSFEVMKDYHFPNKNLFAVLATPCREAKGLDTYQLSCLLVQKVMCNNEQEKYVYYQFPNICYIEGDKIKQVGSFERKVAPALTSGRVVPIGCKIPALISDPHTGARIHDEVVGTYEEGVIELFDREKKTDKEKENKEVSR